MDPLDDYRDEMDRLTPAEIEAMLAGRELDDPAAEPLAAMFEEMRGELLRDPAPDVAARHLAAMRDAARALEGTGAVTTPKTRRKWMRIRGRRRAAALAGAATLALGGGIAAAVTLPDRASDTAKDAVSGAADKSDGGAENAEHGKAVSDAARDTELQGCEKGQAVAGRAASKAAERRQGHGAQDDPCARGGDKGSNGSDSARGSGGGSGGPGGGGGGGGSDVGSGGGSGGPGGGGGGGGSDVGSGGGSGGPGGGGGGGGSDIGSGGGSGGPGGGGGGGGSDVGSGGGSGGPGGGGGGGGSDVGSGGGSGGPGGGSGSGGPGEIPRPEPETPRPEPETPRP